MHLVTIVFARGCGPCSNFKSKQLDLLREQLASHHYAFNIFELEGLNAKMPKELAKYARYVRSFPCFFVLPISSWEQGTSEGIALFNHVLDTRPDGSTVAVPMHPSTPGFTPYTAEGVMSWLQRVAQGPAEEEPLQVKGARRSKGKEAVSDQAHPTCRLKIRSRGMSRH